MGFSITIIYIPPSFVVLGAVKCVLSLDQFQYLIAIMASELFFLLLRLSALTSTSLGMSGWPDFVKHSFYFSLHLDSMC